MNVLLIFPTGQIKLMINPKVRETTFFVPRHFAMNGQTFFPLLKKLHYIKFLSFLLLNFEELLTSVYQSLFFLFLSFTLLLIIFISRFKEVVEGLLVFLKWNSYQTLVANFIFLKHKPFKLTSSVITNLAFLQVFNEFIPFCGREAGSLHSGPKYVNALVSKMSNNNKNNNN